MNNHQLLADYAMKRPLRFFTSFDRELRRMQEKICNESVHKDYGKLALIPSIYMRRLKPSYLSKTIVTLASNLAS